MLEGKRNDIFDSLKGRRAMRAGEAFGYDDPDPTVQVSRFPVSLLQDLMVERRKAKAVLVTILVDLWALSA